MTHTIPPCFYRISTKALIKNGGKILLCREANGFWEFPGGGLEHGEDPKEGLIREVHEEMWVKVINISDKPVCFLTAISSGWTQRANIFYEIEVENLNYTPSDECMEIGFFSLEEMKQIPVLSNVTEFIKIYQP